MSLPIDALQVINRLNNPVPKQSAAGTAFDLDAKWTHKTDDESEDDATSEQRMLDYVFQSYDED